MNYKTYSTDKFKKQYGEKVTDMFLELTGTKIYRGETKQSIIELCIILIKNNKTVNDLHFIQDVYMLDGFHPNMKKQLVLSLRTVTDLS